MRVFQKLEYSTEQLWLDFSKQYSSTAPNILPGRQQAIQDLKDKYLDDEQAEELEEEERREAAERAQRAEEKPLTIWQKAWKVVMENLELGAADPHSPEDVIDDGASDVLSGQEDDDGLNLNKRERKLLHKNAQYSDVI